MNKKINNMFFLSVLFFQFSKETPVRFTSPILKLNYLTDVVGEVYPSIDMPNNWILTITNPEILETLNIERFNLERTVLGTRIYYHSKCVTATINSLIINDCNIEGSKLFTQRFDLEIVHPIENLPLFSKNPFTDSVENINKTNETFSSVKKVSKKTKSSLVKTKKTKNENFHLNSKDIELQEQLRNFLSYK